MTLFEGQEFDTLKKNADAIASKDPNTALAKYKEAFGAAESKGDKVYALGGIVAILIKLENFEEAEKFTEKLVTLSPSNSWAKARLSDIKAKRQIPVVSSTMKKLDTEIAKSETTVDKKELTKKLDTVKGDSDTPEEIVTKIETGEEANEEKVIDILGDSIGKSVAKDATKSTMTVANTTTEPEADLISVSGIASIVAEFTGLPGLFRSSEAIWEWLWCNNKAEYDKAIDDMYMLDIIDFVFWTGACISVAMAAFGGAFAGGIGALPAGGVTAVSAFVSRILGKKIARKVAIKLVFRHASRHIAKQWYKVFKQPAIIKNHLKAIRNTLKKNGYGAIARMRVMKTFKNGKSTQEAFINASKQTKLTRPVPVVRSNSKAVYKIISEMPMSEKLTIANKMGIGSSIATTIIKKGFTIPANISEKAFVQGFGNNKLTMRVIKSYNKAQLVDIGLVITEGVNDATLSDLGEPTNALNGAILEAFASMENVKQAIGQGLWDFRKDFD